MLWKFIYLCGWLVEETCSQLPIRTSFGPRNNPIAMLFWYQNAFVCLQLINSVRNYTLFNFWLICSREVSLEASECLNLWATKLVWNTIRCLILGWLDQEIYQDLFSTYANAISGLFVLDWQNLCLQQNWPTSLLFRLFSFMVLNCWADSVLLKPCSRFVNVCIFQFELLLSYVSGKEKGVFWI